MPPTSTSAVGTWIVKLIAWRLLRGDFFAFSFSPLGNTHSNITLPQRITHTAVLSICGWTLLQISARSQGSTCFHSFLHSRKVSSRPRPSSLTGSNWRIFYPTKKKERHAPLCNYNSTSLPDRASSLPLSSSLHLYTSSMLSRYGTHTIPTTANIIVGR